MADVVGRVPETRNEIAEALIDDELEQKIASLTTPEAEAYKLFAHWFGTYDADGVKGYYTAAETVMLMAKRQIVGLGVVPSVATEPEERATDETVAMRLAHTTGWSYETALKALKDATVSPAERIRGLAATEPPTDDAAKLLPVHADYHYDHRANGGDGGFACECGKPLAAEGSPVPAGIGVMAYRLAQHQVDVVRGALAVGAVTTEAATPFKESSENLNERPEHSSSVDPATVWDDAVEAARKALIARQGMRAWEADIDILSIENPYRVTEAPTGGES